MSDLHAELDEVSARIARAVAVGTLKEDFRRLTDINQLPMFWATIGFDLWQEQVIETSRQLKAALVTVRLV